MSQNDPKRKLTSDAPGLQPIVYVVAKVAGSWLDQFKIRKMPGAPAWACKAARRLSLPRAHIHYEPVESLSSSTLPEHAARKF